MPSPSRVAALFGALVAIPALLAAPVLVGDVNPPPGPVTGTMKPLSQVEPRTPVQSLPGSTSAYHVISQPGAYYLTANVLGSPGEAKSGIRITASHVSVDLAGFAIIGNGATGAGVVGDTSTRGLVVRNGAVNGWDIGIAFNNVAVARVENLLVDGAAGEGIRINTGGIVSGCTATACGAAGIHAGAGALVGGSTVYGCGTGILLGGQGSQAIDCTVYSNVGAGIVAATIGTTIRDCTSSTNGAEGIRVSNRSRVLDNSCTSNFADAGIRATLTDNRIERNTVTSNLIGIAADQGGNFIAGNTAADNGTSYALTGTQTVGPIITATGTIGSTNPWANFEF